MKTNRIFDPNAIWFILHTAIIVLLLITPTACKKHHEHANKIDKQIVALRNATDGFHDIAAAHKAGYIIPIPDNPRECLQDVRLGAMGYHFGNGSLIPDGKLNISNPEVLIYEPQEDGSFELVGVEYVVPFSIRGKDKTPPKLFGHEFQQNERFQVWALHVWAWRNNPSGLFANYNPDVSCI